MEIPLRTVHLDLVLDHNKYQVVIKLDSDYKSIIEVHWDTDPNLLKAKHLVGAMLQSKEDQGYEAFVMVLATSGEVFERVGLFKDPLKAYSSLHRTLRPVTRRHDLTPLTRDVEIEAAYRFDRPAFWLEIFGRNRSVLIR
jgi:hypothetical protein